jgi:glycogen phosphorylase
VSQVTYAKYRIDDITNGVHAATWVGPQMRTLFDRHIPGWQHDNFSLRYALNIAGDELASTHVSAKRSLLNAIEAKTSAKLDETVLTIGCARRFTAYKRADLLFHDVERLRTIANTSGKLQVIFSGKAHPHDQGGKEIIQRLFRIKEALNGDIRIVYIENYSLDWAKLLTAGVDVWLNTPLPPLEASGTSGMKAAMNGVPSLSVLDGWWVEGCIEGVTGWAIGDAAYLDDGPNTLARNSRDAASLYLKLQEVVLPLYYNQRDRFIDVMRHAIAINGSFFNTQRMIQQYVVKAYL